MTNCPRLRLTGGPREGNGDGLHHCAFPVTPHLKWTFPFSPRWVWVSLPEKILKTQLLHPAPPPPHWSPEDLRSPFPTQDLGVIFRLGTSWHGVLCVQTCVRPLKSSLGSFGLDAYHHRLPEPERAHLVPTINVAPSIRLPFRVVAAPSGMGSSFPVRLSPPPPRIKEISISL